MDEQLIKQKLKEFLAGSIFGFVVGSILLLIMLRVAV